MPVFKLNDVFAGRYVLSELIGEGGFSEVWKAKDQMADDAVVALKIYAPEKGLDDYGVRQFRREFSLTHHLSHPHLLRVYHFDISEGSPYLIMPYCSQGSLNKLLSEEGSFSERQVALIFCQIGSALEELHQQDPPILHQDIKPDNILISQPENFLLADFGISSQIRHTMQKSTSDTKSLTVAYAPPERFDRFLVTDTSGDIFSLGVTIYEMCTKRIPWEGSGGQSLLKGGHVPNLPERYSPELNKILQDCMSSNRGKRPSATELHLRGKNFLETGKWDLPEKKEAKGNFVLKKKLPVVLGAAAAALLVFGGLWVYQANMENLPDDKPQKIASSGAEEQEVSSMVDQVMEEELRMLARKTVELEEANKRLLQNDSANKALIEERERKISQYQRELEQKSPVRGTVVAQKEVVSSKTVVATSEPKAAPSKPKEEKKAVPVVQAAELEFLLNKISDPQLSRQDRNAWKQKTMDLFADGAQRIMDETEEIPKQYSASIFLNLISNVPHNIQVKDVERDAVGKITELRLIMDTDR